MKYTQWIGVGSVIILIISCYLPWTYHPDLHKTFTGFFSENNVYGKPGKFFILFGTAAIVFFLLPKIWAKRWNLLICALSLAYAIKCFVLFSGCYRGICPERKEGLWIMLFMAIVMMAMAVVPDIKVTTEKREQ